MPEPLEIPRGTFSFGLGKAFAAIFHSRPGYCLLGRGIPEARDLGFWVPQQGAACPELLGLDGQFFMLSQ